MQRILILGLLGLILACGGAESSDGRSGMGGVGGSGVTEEHDATCRAFCANEPGGSTCGPGVRFGGTIQQCYEGCLNELSQRQCKAEWVDQLECHLDLDCDDIFGDCERANLEEAWQECEDRAQADEYCAEQCPEQNREACIAQYQSTGRCDDASTPPDPGQLCDEICGRPDECFTQLGVPIQGDCVETCVAQAGLVGIACISAINSTIECLGTCDVESLTVEQQLACQDEAEAISAACEGTASTCATLTNPPEDCGKSCTSDTQCEASFCSNGECVAQCTPDDPFRGILGEGCDADATCNARGRCVRGIIIIE